MVRRMVSPGARESMSEWYVEERNERETKKNKRQSQIGRDHYFWRRPARQGVMPKMINDGCRKERVDDYEEEKKGEEREEHGLGVHETRLVPVFNAQMVVGKTRCNPSPRGPLKKSELHEVRLVYLFNSAFLLRCRCRKRGEPDRAALEISHDRIKDAPVGRVKPHDIDLKQAEGDRKSVV